MGGYVEARMGLFSFFIYYNIYYKFCPNVQWYGRVITCRCPDKGGVLAPGRDKGGPLRGRITGMGGLGRVRIIYICVYTYIQTYKYIYTYIHMCVCVYIYVYTYIYIYKPIPILRHTYISI